MIKVIQTYYSGLYSTLHYFTFINCDQEPLIIVDSNKMFESTKILLFGLSRLDYVKDITEIYHPYKNNYIKIATIPIFNNTNQLIEVIKDINPNEIKITRNYKILLHNPNTTDLKSKISSKKVSKIVNIVKDVLAKHKLITLPEDT